MAIEKGSDHENPMQILDLLISARPYDLENRGGDYSSVLVILDKLRPSTRIVDAITEKLVTLYEESRKNYLLTNQEALRAALKAVEYGISKEVVEKIVGSIATTQWNNNLETVERLAGRFLDRKPTLNEISSVVQTYVNNMSSRSEGKEKRIVQIAERYLSPSEVTIIKSEISDFVTRWTKNSGDY